MGENNSSEDKRLLDKLKDEVRRKKKNKMKEFVKKKIIALAIPVVMHLLKILLISIAVMTVVSMIHSVVSGFLGFLGIDANAENTGNYGSSQIVQIEDDVSQEELEEFIDIYVKKYGGSEEIKHAMKEEENLKEIIEWQSDYEFSAYIFVAMAFEENLGEDFDTIFNTLDTKGKDWKEGGATSLEGISRFYVEDDTYEEWANTMKNKISKVIIEMGD